MHCHGRSKAVADFEKPVEVALKFIARENTILRLNDYSSTKRIVKRNILYKHPEEQIYGYDSKERIKNYSLNGLKKMRYTIVMSKTVLNMFIN